MSDWVGFPFPGEQFVEPVDGVVGDARDDVGEPCLGFDAVQPGGLDEGIEDGGAMVAGVGAGEEIVLAAEMDHHLEGEAGAWGVKYPAIGMSWRRAW